MNDNEDGSVLEVEPFAKGKKLEACLYELENEIFNSMPVGSIKYFSLSIHPYNGMIFIIFIPFRDKALGKAAQTSPRPPLEANGTISLLTNKIFTRTL